MVKQHQRQQALAFGVRLVGTFRQQGQHQLRQTNGFLTEIMTQGLLAGRRQIALVEHQIDHLQDRLQTLRQCRAFRHLVGNLRIADLALGADNTLGHSGGFAEKGTGDGFRGQSTHFP